MRMHDVVELLQATEGEFRADGTHLHVRLALPMDGETRERLERNPLPADPVRGFGLPMALMTVADAFAPGYVQTFVGRLEGFDLGLVEPNDLAFQAGLEAATETLPASDDTDFRSVATFSIGRPNLFVDVAVNVEDGLVSVEVFSQPGMQQMTAFDGASLGKLIEALQVAQRALDNESARLGT